MPSTKITDLTAYSDPASTDVLPIVDVGADTTKKVSIADLMENAGAGTAAAPGIAFDGDSNTGIYRPGADEIAIATGGTLRLSIDSAGAVTIPGDLTVEGTTTTIDSETLRVKDKNIEMAVVDTPTDVTANGGGITLKGSTDKTINWLDATDSWTSSEHLDLANGKSYRINNTQVLSSTTLGSGVTGSSLTSVGTLTGLTVSGDITMTGTGAIDVASGTAAERPGSPSAGMIRFNTDDTTFEGYNGSAWGAIGGGATGGGSDKWAVEHDNTVNSSYTITSGRNVITAGPMTIASGATVTVPTGSSWVIV